MTTNAVNNSVYGDFSVKDGASGSSRVLRIENENDSASSEAAIETQVGGTSADDTYFRYVVSTTNSWSHGIDQTDSQSFNMAYAASATATPSSTKAIKATTDGELLYPSQPIFKAYLSSTASNVTGDGTVYTVAFASEEVDQNSNYNTSTYRFVAPKDGKYLLAYNVMLGGAQAGTTSTYFYLYKNGSEKLTTYNISAAQKRNTSDEFGVNGLVIADLSANDYVDVRGSVSGGSKVVDVQATDHRTFFGGCLLG